LAASAPFSARKCQALRDPIEVVDTHSVKEEAHGPSTLLQAVAESHLAGSHTDRAPNVSFAVATDAGVTFQSVGAVAIEVTRDSGPNENVAKVAAVPFKTTFSTYLNPLIEVVVVVALAM